MSKSYQVIKCTKCFKEHIEDVATGRTPWDIWPKGCPRCGNGNVDVDVVVDRR